MLSSKSSSKNKSSAEQEMGLGIYCTPTFQHSTRPLSSAGKDGAVQGKMPRSSGGWNTLLKWLCALAGDPKRQSGHCNTHLTITEQNLLPPRVYAHDLALSEAVPKGDRVGDESLLGKSCGKRRQWENSPLEADNLLCSWCPCSEKQW